MERTPSVATNRRAALLDLSQRNEWLLPLYPAGGTEGVDRRDSFLRMG